jgi:hypothetical protein
MKTFLLLWCIACSGTCFSQNVKKTQLQHLIYDSEVFFIESKGGVERISGEDTSYASKVRLNGKQNGSISFRSGKTKWAVYSGYLLESASLKDAKKEALLWREIIRSVATSYTEEVKQGSDKNIHGNPQHEYSFTKVEAGRKSWINVLYAKDKKAYYVYLSIGWQDWL